MRCKACNNPLSDREATNRCVVTGEYPDLCKGCLGGLGILVKENLFNKDSPVDAPELTPTVEELKEDDLDEYDFYHEALGG